MKALRQALDLAESALFDIYVHEGARYGENVAIQPGGPTIRERINRFNTAIYNLNQQAAEKRARR